MSTEDLNYFRTDLNQVDGLINQCVEMIEDNGVEDEANFEPIYALFMELQTEITNFQERQKWIWSLQVWAW